MTYTNRREIYTKKKSLIQLLLIALLAVAIILGLKFLAILSIPITPSQITSFPIIPSAILLVILLIFRSSIKIIGQGYEGIVERLGRYHRTLKPGINFILPLFDTVIVETTREQILDIPPQSVITRDNVIVQVDAVLFWKILDTARAYYAIENLEEALKNLVLTILRSEIGKMELKQTFHSRHEVNVALLQQLDQTTEFWGVKIMRVEIQEISLSAPLLNALEKEQVAESLRRAAISEAQGMVQAINLLRYELKDVDGKTILHHLLAQKYIESCGRIGESKSSKVLFMNPNVLNESISELLNFNAETTREL